MDYGPFLITIMTRIGLSQINWFFKQREFIIRRNISSDCQNIVVKDEWWTDYSEISMLSEILAPHAELDPWIVTDIFQQNHVKITLK